MMLYFLDECFLFVSLPVLLSLNFLVKPFEEEAVLSNPVLVIKKQFFINLRFAQLVLFLTALLSCVMVYYQAPQEVIFQHYGNFFFRKDALITFFSTMVTLGAMYYLYLVGFLFLRMDRPVRFFAEIPFLILATVLSLRLFVATNDLMLLALLVEISAFCSVILIGIQSLSQVQVIFSIEAAIKYFIINAVAISLLMFGIVVYFFLTNTVNVIDISLFFQKYPYLLIFSAEQLVFAHLFFFFAYFIKIGAAPVHQWVPDVYEGSETYITAFLVLIISPILLLKFILLWKQLLALSVASSIVCRLVQFFGWCSLIIGTLNAFYQTKIKRFIAYAGLTHLGFILLSLACNDLFGYFSALSYLIIYYLTNLAFFTLLLMAQAQLQRTHNSVIYINQLKVLFQTSPFFFYGFVIVLLSFAGIPPFAGFFIKFFVFVSILNQGQIFFALCLISIILVGTYMYLRFLKMAVFEQFLRSSIMLKIISSFVIDYYRLTRKYQKTLQHVSLSWWEERGTALLLFLLLVLCLFTLILPVFGVKVLELTLFLMLLY